MDDDQENHQLQLLHERDDDDDDDDDDDHVPFQDRREKVAAASGSSEASAAGDGKPMTNRLWIKLIKIRKAGEYLSGSEASRPPGDQEPRRICKVCNKGFSSGKALGGHMRVHVQPNKDLKTIHHYPKLNRLSGAPVKTTNNAPNPMAKATKPTCSICAKNFPSMKSLFGHMRCHPERERRGIHPPPAANNTSSGTSTLSVDALVRRADDQIDSATTTVAAISSIVVDLSQSLSSGWSVTAKRGRKSMATSPAGSASEEPIPDAVYDLMMLAHGNSLNSSFSHKKRVEEIEATNSNSLTINKAEIEDKDHAAERVAPSKKRRIDDQVSPVGNRRNSPSKKLKIDDDERGSTDAGNSRGHDIILSKKMDRGGKGKALLETGFVPEESVNMECGWEDRDCPREDHENNKEVESDSENTNGERQLNYNFEISRKMRKKKKKKKKRRKMKLTDLETVAGDVAPVNQVHKHIPMSAPDRYKCSTCNKTFPTHQALGGHRSSHNKVKNSPIKDESAFADEEEHYEFTASANPSSPQVQEIDECCEEAAGSRVVVTTHQCKICNKTFTTGQALGGHKRCHWTGPIEAPRSQVASPGESSQTGRKILDFDLNELPAMEEDEENIGSAFTQSEHAAGYAS